MKILCNKLFFFLFFFSVIKIQFHVLMLIKLFSQGKSNLCWVQEAFVFSVSHIQPFRALWQNTFSSNQVLQCPLFKVSPGNENGQSHPWILRAARRVVSGGTWKWATLFKVHTKLTLGNYSFQSDLLFKLKHESTVHPPTHLLSSLESQRICSDVENVSLGYALLPVVRRKNERIFLKKKR